MYKLNPGGRFAQTQNLLSKAFEKPEAPIGRLDNPFMYQQTQQKEVQQTNQVPILTPTPTTPQVASNNTSEEEYKKMKTELEGMFNEKFSKLDEMLMLLKESNAKQNEIQKQVSNQVNPNQGTAHLQNMSFIQPKPNVIETTIKEKQPRTKRTYYPITEMMWGEVKAKFVDLPDEYRSKTFSDGVDFFIEMQNKKNLLDNRLLLKILNKKK